MSVDPQYALLMISVLGACFCAALVAYSIRYPAVRIWPVPSADSHLNRTRALLNRVVGWVIGLSFVALVCVAFLDYGSLQLPAALHLSAGAALLLSGGALAQSGFRTLGPEVSTGTPGRLQQRGPYRFSRNPQYVGTVGALAGIALVSNSTLALLTAASWFPFFLLAPLAEEPWLLGRIGTAYESYLSNTRRYL